MQASGSEMPTTMMLGIEGFYGLVVGTIIYATFAEQLAPIEDIDSTLSTLRANAGLRWWLVRLPSTFLVMGLFNIKATERTSAMTRNVWKTLRPVAVWAVALAVFYVGDDPALGEEWHVPESFAILFGFIVMSAGIIAYYSPRVFRGILHGVHQQRSWVRRRVGGCSSFSPSLFSILTFLAFPSLSRKKQA